MSKQDNSEYDLYIGGLRSMYIPNGDMSAGPLPLVLDVMALMKAIESLSKRGNIVLISDPYNVPAPYKHDISKPVYRSFMFTGGKVKHINDDRIIMTETLREHVETLVPFGEIYDVLSEDAIRKRHERSDKNDVRKFFTFERPSNQLVKLVNENNFKSWNKVYNIAALNAPEAFVYANDNFGLPLILEKVQDVYACLQFNFRE